MSEHPSADSVILTHATFAALTPLIPVPFVDGMARDRVMRRMVTKLADLHHLNIWEAEVKTLADEESKLLRGMVKKVVLTPFRFALRRVFFVLVGKRIIDLASRCYHHGFLVDRAFANRWCAPAGKKRSEEIRAAIDQVLENEPIASSPVTRAIGIGYQSSQRALFDTYNALRDRLSGASDASAIDEAADDDAGLDGLVGAVQRALTDVPSEHFDELERKLRVRLFGEDTGIEVRDASAS